MLATALSATLMGLEAHPVRVEVETQRNVPAFELVGLAEASVRESRVRVKSALAHVGIDLSEYRIVVNLAPADLKKSGSGFDLAIAATTLAALGVVEPAALDGILFLGELSLNGVVHPLRGVLPHLLAARTRGLTRAIVPRANADEAALVSGVDVRTVDTLRELLESLRDGRSLPAARRAAARREADPLEDLADVRGQAGARRAIEIAAAGAHNLLMMGPPGSGKTMLARRIAGVLPPMHPDEELEVMAVHSIAGLLGHKARAARRPFRAPHHTVSEVALVGGGETPRPGEVSLAHRGVLFLDELPEFRRGALESLRQPLEDGVVTVSRAQARATFPARPLVVAAMNPCPCGYLGDATPRCTCSSERVRAYRGRVSGPLLDRIDVHVVLPPVTVSSLQGASDGEPTLRVRARVEAARQAQLARFERREASSPINATLGPADLDRVAKPCEDGARLLASAFARLALSARAYGKLLRVARTLADLDGSTHVAPRHVAEAIGARVLDRGAGVTATAA
jgi:magnesium chelatase family protein